MKKKFLALTLSAGIMMMGAGYAYWTDALTVNNTVATGELNVHFVDQNVTRGGDNGADPYWGAYVKHEGRNNGPATVVDTEGKTVTTTVENMYPGAYAQYYGTIENDGTIPAVFDNATVSFTGANDSATLSTEEEELKNNLKFAIGYKIVDANNNPTHTDPNTGDKRFWITGTMANFEEKINTLFANVKLEPGERLLLDFPSVEDAQAAMAEIGYPYNDQMHCITYTLSTDADDTVENQELGIKIQLNWKQHNAQ